MNNRNDPRKVLAGYKIKKLRDEALARYELGKLVAKPRV
jgi:hypothetical protein